MMNDHKTGPTSTDFVIIVAIIVACVLITAFGTYGVGYKNGQIDALEGNAKYISVETEEGVYWYKSSRPMTMYKSRNESGDGS